MNKNKLEQKLKSLNLITDKKNHDQGYAWHPDARHDFDLARFLNNQAYWKITDGQKELFNKKIVLNNYRLLYSGRDHFFSVLAFLVRQGFSLYVRSAPGKLEIINNIDNLNSKIINKIQLADNETIFNELNAIEEKPEDFYILDHTNDADLVKDFASFIGLNEYDAQKKSLDKFLSYQGIYLFDRSVQLLSDNNIDYLSGLGSQGIFKFFRVDKHQLSDYRHPENNDTQQVYLKWNVTHNKEENKKILTEIKNAIDPDLEKSENILPYQSASDLSYADGGITDLNLNEFKNLKNIKIFASENLVNIHGFYEQKQLEKLLLQLKNDISYSFAQFPLLNSLSMIVSPKHHLKQMLENSTIKKIDLSFTNFDPDLSGLSAAKELSDITLHLSDQKKPINLNISALTKLKKLKLAVSSYVYGDEYKVVSIDLPIKIVSDGTNCPLEELDLNTSTSKTKVSYEFLTPLPNLKRLKLFEANGIDLNELLKRCPNLEELEITQLSNLDKLDLSALKNLKSLKIFLCSPLSKISGLNQCQQLKVLDIASYYPIDGLDLSSHNELESIDLSLHNSPVAIALPVRPQSIKKFRISGAMDVLDLMNFSNLEKLTLGRCEINDIRNIADCTNLKKVSISEAKNLKSLDFSNNKKIHELDIEDNNIKYINASTLTNLEKIEIRGTFFGKLDCELYLPPNFDEKTLHTCNIKTQKLVLNYSEHDSLIDGFKEDNNNIKHRKLKKLPITHVDAPLLDKQKRKKAEQERQQSYGYSNYSNTSSSAYPSGFYSNFKNPKTLSINGNTYSSPNKTLYANEFFSDSISTPDVSHYRTTIYDHFDYNKYTGLKLEQVDYKSYLKIYTPKENRTSLFKKPTATIEDHFISGKYYCLPGISSADALTHFNHPDLFDIFQCDLTNQFYIKLKDNIEDFDGAIQYTINPDDTYFFFSPTDRIASQITVPKLPGIFKNSLDGLFAKNKTLQTLTQLPTDEAKVRALIEYCNFKNESLSDDDPFSENEDLSSLIKLIDEQKGKCDQRSFAFMALCHYLNIPARMIENDCHAFVEVPTVTSRGVKWTGIELGGAEGKLKIIKKSVNLPPWLDLANNASHDRSFKIEKVDQAKPIDEGYLPYILPNKNQLDDCKTFSQAMDKLLLQPKAVLFRNDSGNVLSYYQGLYHYYQQKNIPSVFINSVEDLKDLFEPIRIYDTKEGKDVLYSHVDGPIKQMLQNKCGAIFINWNNFSEHDKAIYKCLIEDSPSYDNFPIPKEVRIFGILQKDKHANDVFLTRNLSISLEKSVEPQNTRSDSDMDMDMDIDSKMDIDVNMDVDSDMDIDEPLDSLVKTNSKSNHIQLYRGSDWKSLLLNDYITKGDVMHVHKGALVKALRNGESITLINPPNDQEFKLIIERIKTEGKIYVNGEWITKKSGFQLHLEEQLIELKTPDHMIIDSNNETKGKKYYLNNSNFDSLFKQCYVDNTSKIFITDGWLKEITSQDKIIVTSALKEEQWQKLFDTIETLKLDHDIHFHFRQTSIPSFFNKPLEEKKASIPLTATDDLQNKPENTGQQFSLAQLHERLLLDNHLHVETNDPSFIADQFKKQCGLTSENVFYTNTENSWSDFIERVNKPEIINHRLRAKRTEGPVLEKLKNGETVILCGNLSSQDYANLQTLFCDNPYLQVNGHRVELPGRLLLISNKLNHDPNKLHETYSINSDIDDYQKILRQEITDLDENKLLKLNIYFKYLRRTIDEPHDPTYEQYTYAKFKQMYLAISAPNNFENPLKFVNQYYYQKNTENNAFLNVLGKALLSQTPHNYLRPAKLGELLKHIYNEDDFEQKFWQLLNCLNIKRFVQLLVEDKFLMGNSKNNLLKPSSELRHAVLLNLCQLFPDLLQQTWIKEKISNEKLNIISSNDPIKTLTDRYKKQKQQLIDAINDSSKPLIYLLGNSGTGKTFTVKKLCKKLPHVNFYASEKDTINWLKPRGDGKIKVLLLDEANLSSALHWEFLRGLKQKPQVVYFEGKPYPLSDKHKIVFTGNPLNYPGRQFQPVIWDHAHVIWFSKFSKDFISKKINKFLIKLNRTLPHNTYLQDITDRIYDAYHYLENSDQRIAEITIRDIENICARFLLLQEKNLVNAAKANLSQAIYTEMNGILLNSTARHNFKDFLRKGCANLPPPIPSNYADVEFVVSPKKEKIWQLINEDLELRKMRIRYESNNIGKLGILVEGPSGIGKTKFFVKALEHKGFQCANNLTSDYDLSSDNRRVFYHLMAGSKNNREILLKAFHQGAIVIFDELNLEPELEDLLNQLLSGKDPEDHEAKRPGFMILASQNPAFYDGCTTLSRAQINRFHRINMKDYKENDLVYIAEKMAITKPQLFINTFFYSKDKNPNEVNSRNCFHAMNTIRRNKPH